jgi:hypothetical protein
VLRHVALGAASERWQVGEGAGTAGFAAAAGGSTSGRASAGDLELAASLACAGWAEVCRRCVQPASPGLWVSVQLEWQTRAWVAAWDAVAT